MRRASYVLLNRITNETAELYIIGSYELSRLEAYFVLDSNVCARIINNILSIMTSAIKLILLYSPRVTFSNCFINQTHVRSLAAMYTILCYVNIMRCSSSAQIAYRPLHIICIINKAQTIPAADTIEIPQ